MALQADFQWMARYNQWMNASLYAHAAALDARELQADRGAFFGSILATLAHIHSADVVWLKRFAAVWPALGSLDDMRTMAQPPLVRGIVYPDFAALRHDRARVDAAFVAFVLEADDTLYARALTYTDSVGTTHAKPAGLVLRHVFNHQTHHRGQVTTLFSQLGIDVGVTDLLALVPDVVP